MLGYHRLLHRSLQHLQAFLPVHAETVTLKLAAIAHAHGSLEQLAHTLPHPHCTPLSVCLRVCVPVCVCLHTQQSMGMKVVCTWGFNDKFPSQPGVYSEQQGKALDYVIAGAARRGMRVELALANLWPAYLGPEVWLTWAAGSAEGKTVADFYRCVSACTHSTATCCYLLVLLAMHQPATEHVSRAASPLERRLFVLLLAPLLTQRNAQEPEGAAAAGGSHSVCHKPRQHRHWGGVQERPGHHWL